MQKEQINLMVKQARIGFLVDSNYLLEIVKAAKAYEKRSSLKSKS